MTCHSPKIWALTLVLATSVAPTGHAGRLQSAGKKGLATIARANRAAKGFDRPQAFAAGLLGAALLYAGSMAGPAIGDQFGALISDAKGTVYTSAASEPRLLAGDAGSVGWSTMPNAKLVVTAPKLDQINQTGQIGDCGLDATLASAVVKRPQLIANALVKNADGTITFKSHESVDPMWVRIGPDGSLSGQDPNQALASTAAKEVKMTAALPRSASIFSGWLGSSPHLLKGTYHASGAGSVQWGPMIEKGVAQQGLATRNAPGGAGYETLYAIPASQAMTQLTGKQSQWFLTVDNDPTRVWNALKLATDGNRLVVAGTHQPSWKDDAVATLHGMFTQHYYSVLGTTEKLGIEWVTLRNPHGSRFYGAGSAVFNVTLSTYMATITQTEIN